MHYPLGDSSKRLASDEEGKVRKTDRNSQAETASQTARQTDKFSMDRLSSFAH